MKIKAWIVAILSAAALCIPSDHARAATLQCDQLSGGMGLCIPRFGTAGDHWGRSIINALTTINSTAVVGGTSMTASSGSLFVAISSTNYVPWLVSQGNNSNSIFLGNMERTNNPVGLIFTSSRTAAGGRLGSIWQYYGNTPVVRMDFNKNGNDKNSGSIAFITYNQGSSANRMVITSTGNIGVGTDSPPSTATFYVSGAIGTNANARFDNSSANTALDVRQLTASQNSGQFISLNSAGVSKGVFIRAGTNSSDEALNVENAAGTGTLLKVQGDGKTGIGLTVPTARLHLYEPSVQALITESAEGVYGASFTAGGYGAVIYGGSVASGYVKGSMISSYSKIPFYVGANVQSFVPSIVISTVGTGAGGNVGINLSPDRICSTCTLQVNGGISATTLSGDGSGITNIGGFVTLGATQTFTGGNTFVSSVTVTSANCIGLDCRVGYSSGTINTFSFVMTSTNVYRLEYSVTATTGSTTADRPFTCTINADATAGNYGNMIQSYADAYSINNAGSAAYWGMCAAGGSTISANEGCTGNMTIRHQWGLSNVLTMTGQSSVLITAASPTTFNTQTFAGMYAGAAPWTIRCTPAAGMGWNYEASLYKVGK